MKGRHGKRKPHIVALAPQAVELIHVARRLKISEQVFPADKRSKA